MDIRLAENCGFCYGVKRAVKMAEEAATLDGITKTLGPIIHNPQVVGKLEDRGISVAESLDDFTTGNVIIRSHGVGPETYERAESKGLHIVDATCPHVKKAQRDAKEVVDAGMQLVILGEHHHPEVKSINLWANEKGIIIESEEEAESIQFVEKMGVVVQTTFSQYKFLSIIKTLETKTNELKVFKTICQATEDRQNSAVSLAKEVQMMIVVGGKNSGNTRRLAEVCQSVGTPAYHIETAAELELSWFDGIDSVGVTAGASTPDWIIKEVISRMNEFEELLGAQDQNWAENLKKGTVVDGTVVQVESDKAWVDIGYKTEACLNASEFAYPAPADLREVLHDMDPIKAVIISHIKEDSPIYLSKTRLAKEEDWKAVLDAQANDQTVTAEGLEAIPAGLVVKVNSLRGFIPLSQGDVHFVKSLESLVGKKFDAKVLEIDERKNRLVLSRRAVLEVERQARLAEVLGKLEVGNTYTGEVRKIMPYGAFVDIGGIEGLLHISDISWKIIRKVEDVLNVGDKVEVKLQSYDAESNKISLSMKALSMSPWEEAAENIHVGDVLIGKVVRLVAYGAFVAVNDDIQGLLHVSQITKQRNAKVEDYLTRGEEVEVKVLSFNQEEKKLGLGLVNLLEPVESESAEEEATENVEA